MGTSWAKYWRRLLAAGGARLGGASNYTDISTAGRLTMAGTARVRKDIWIPADEFWAQSPCSGSMSSGSLLLDVTGSAFAGVSGSMAQIRVFQPAANVTGSPTTATATFRVPRDKDTTGSVACNVEWTAHDTHATSGSVFVIKAALGYLAGSAVVRTAASVGASPAYNYTASGTWHSTNIGNLPSFGANDTMGILVLRHDQSESDDTGGSGIAFAGVRLTYTACALGTASSE